jgi:hypothetical protein
MRDIGKLLSAGRDREVKESDLGIEGSMPGCAA